VIGFCQSRLLTLFLGVVMLFTLLEETVLTHIVMTRNFFCIMPRTGSVLCL